MKAFAQMTAEERTEARAALEAKQQRIMADRAKAEEGFKARASELNAQLDQLALLDRLGGISEADRAALRAMTKEG